MKKALFTNEDGTIIVDAAICLPIFIILMAIMMMLTIQCGIEEAAYTRLADEARESCKLIAASGLNGSELTVSESIHTNVPVPAGFAQRLDAKARITYRPFIGESDDFAAACTDLIFIFPKYGEKYHGDGCIMFKIYPDNYTVMRKDEAIAAGYTACMLCGGGE